MEKALCGLIFNAQGYLHELLKQKQLSTEPLLQSAKMKKRSK
jgi:hypothetical protein